jgi:bifunctional ADP-heptose synthase (sugar kinase/adenylyltransferase)
MVKSGNKFAHDQAHAREILDVSGAGDTVISVASLALACKVDELTLAKLSNLAGGLVCENVGVVPVDKQRLLEEAIIHLSA